ncbi:MAG: hypothetical protein BWY96_01073 [Spirochaetes bacterium ADurb.BinA120]|nr:MAG: hypothetical protein BWY96_01073 [Spirochaetes bacterium ADurb.BinA120]HOD42012.1 prepilin-type N-terminal cleavage/methylation domain-containing protein [Candidatus Wallbacteria bacterium]
MEKINKDFSLNKIKRAKCAFTVTEVLIAAAIMSMLLGVFYQLFIAGHKNFNAGVWMANLTQEINVGFRQFQEDIKNTAVMVSTVPGNYYKTNVKPEPNHNPAFDFYYNSKLLSPDGAQPGDKLMRFKMCRRPQKKGFETKLDNQPALIEEAEFSLNEKGELFYEKKSALWDGDPKSVPTLNPPADKLVNSRVLIHDVTNIRFVPQKNATKIEKGKMFGIEITVAPPKNQGRNVKPLVKTTQVVINVEPNESL